MRFYIVCILTASVTMLGLFLESTKSLENFENNFFTVILIGVVIVSGNF